MATRSLNVVITGDSKGIGIAAREADGHLRVVQRSAKATGTALKLGFGVAAGAALVGVGFLKKSADAAKEAETSHARLVAQLKASGISYHAHGKEIDAVIQKHSKLAGIDDEDLQDAFTNLVRSTGSVSKSMKDMGLVTDIARAKHISVTKAADLLGKVHAGNIGVLKRYGIAFDPVTKAQDKLKESNKNATAEQIKAAKAADKATTSQRAIAELQKRFGGQAEAYGKTAAGAQERFGVAVENVEEKLGAKLLPVIAKVAGGVAKFLEQMDSGKGVGGRFAAAISTGFNTAKNVIGAVVRTVRKFLQEHRQDIQDVIRAFKRVAEFARATWQETLLPIVKRTVGAIKPIVQGLVDVIRGVVRLVSGLLSGNWSKAWDGAKETVRGAWKVIKTLVKTGIENLWELIKDLGPKLVKLIAKGMGNLGKALATGIWEGIKAAAKALPGLAGDALKGIGKTIGKTIIGAIPGAGVAAKILGIGDGLGKLQIGGGDFGGGLHGANPALGGVASLAGKFGLSISAGRSDHSRTTTSGNVSYHSSGEALDFSNGVNTPAERGFQKFMHDRFGGRIAELIGPVPSLNLKDGSPYPYSGAIQAQHKNHVHVALDLGRPGVGVGDGLGKGDGIGFRGLEDLWVRAGGSAKIAPLMAHVAQAESGGDPAVRNPSGASGLWQILGQPFKGNVFDPLTNARMAVWKYQHQGLGAWAASKGSWGRYVGSGETYSGSGGSGGSGGRSKPAFVSHPGSSDFAAEEHASAVRNARRRAVVRTGPAKGLTPKQLAQTADEFADPNQALIDATNALAEIEKQRVDLESQLAANQLKILALAGQGDQIVNAVIAAVNGGIGRDVGLSLAGLRSPAGSVGRL